MIRYDSVIKEIWVKAGVIGPIKRTRFYYGNPTITAMRFHKLTYQALWRILVPQMLLFCKDHNRALNDTLNTLVSNAVQDSDLDFLTSSFVNVMQSSSEQCSQSL